MDQKYIGTELEENSVFRYELLILLGHIVESLDTIASTLEETTKLERWRQAKE